MAANGHFPINMPCSSAAVAQKICAADMGEKDFSVRVACQQDIDDLLVIEKECWPSELQIGREVIASRLAMFPAGQWVAEHQNRVVGVLYTQRVARTDVLLTAQFETLRSLHDPSGSILELVAVAVLPTAQHLQIGQTLRDFMLLQAQVCSDLSEVVAITRCSGYIRSQHHNYQHYAISSRDPTLQFHCMGGAEILGIVPNYRPEDICNEGNGVLISYAHRLVTTPPLLLPLPLAEPLTMDTLRDIISQTAGEAFTYTPETFVDTPLMNFGIDSLQMLQITNHLQQHAPQHSFSTTFLFDYPTPRRDRKSVV